MAKMSYAYAQYQALQAEMRLNPLVTHYYEYAYPSAVGPAGEVIDIAKEFGAMPRTSGKGWAIDEFWYIIAGTGASINGIKPVVRFPAMTTTIAVEYTFLQSSKIRHMTGGQGSAPIVIWQDAAGRTYGRAGGSAGQHTDVGQEVMYANMAGLVVVAPSDAYTAKGLLVSAMRSKDPVMYWDYSEVKAGEQPDVPVEQYTVPFGKAKVVQEGTDMTIVCWAPAIVDVRKAMPDLAKAGIKAEVIDLLTIKPMDVETVLKSVNKTKRLLVVDHGHWTASFGSHVITEVVTAIQGVKVKKIAYPDAPEPFASSMAAWMRPDAPKIVLAAQAVMKL